MTKTINGLSAVTSAAAGDFIPVWRAANGDTKKITKANLIGASITGGGTLSTGGFTGVLPATGTLALLGVAQTYTGMPTYSAGISFGQVGGILDHYDNGLFTPTMTFGGGSTGITYSVRDGRWQKIGNRTFVQCHMLLSNKGSSTGSVAIGTLPHTVLNVANYFAVGSCYAASGTITGDFVAFTIAGATTISLNVVNNAGAATSATDANFTNTTRLIITLEYFA